jgi:hypothetical protein
MTFEQPGRFILLQPKQPAGAIVLRREPHGGEPAFEFVFARVTQHDLPATLNGVSVREYGFTDREWLVNSAARDYRVQARSLQVHENASLYGSVLPPPRLATRQRLLWKALLWLVRFGWGRALIRWLRAK